MQRLHSGQTKLNRTFIWSGLVVTLNGNYTCAVITLFCHGNIFGRHSLSKNLLHVYYSDTKCSGADTPISARHHRRIFGPKHHGMRRSLVARKRAYKRRPDRSEHRRRFEGQELGVKKWKHPVEQLLPQIRRDRLPPLLEVSVLTYRAS